MPQDCETACEFSVGLGALLLLLVGCGRAVVVVPFAVSADLVVKAQGGVAPAVGVPVGRGGVMWGSCGRVLQ